MERVQHINTQSRHTHNHLIRTGKIALTVLIHFLDSSVSVCELLEPIVTAPCVACTADHHGTRIRAAKAVRLEVIRTAAILIRIRKQENN